MTTPKPASRAHRLLRDRRFTSFLALFAVTALSALAAVFLVEKFVVLKNLDNVVQDREIAKESSASPDNRVSIVALDEQTLKLFPYRTPIDRAFLATLISRIDSAHPRAIGIDILFDQRTEKPKDDALENVLKTAKSPIVIAYTDHPQIVTPVQLNFEHGFVPDSMRATTDLPTDRYGTVRTVHPGLKESNGRYLLSFEGALASKWPVHTPSHEVPIVWHTPVDGNKSNYFEISAEQVTKYPAPLFTVLGPALFKNKIVLIGADESLIDRWNTPISSALATGDMAGVIVHAYGISTLLDGAVSPYATWRLNFFVALMLAAIGSVLGLLNFHLLPRIGILVGILAAYFAGCVYLYHYQNLLLGLTAPALAMLASFAAMDSLTGRDARKQRQFIQGAFSRYVTPKVVEALIEDPSRMSLEGERREMTFLFTDIADFTTMSEKIDSHDLSRILNEYFEGMTSVVLKYDGMVDKFIGDAVFAIFNAPVDVPEHASRAVHCALEMDAFSNKFRKEQHDAGIGMGITRIGIHTGDAVIGNFGSKSRFNYTAHGDAVNTAARLEGLNKEFGTHVCVSGSAKALCRDKNLVFRPIGSVVLKGKTEAVEVWEPLHEGAMTADQLARYKTAYEDMHDPDSESLSLFESLAEELPDDPCIRHHIKRIRKGIRDRELVMTEK